MRVFIAHDPVKRWTILFSAGKIVLNVAERGGSTRQRRLEGSRNYYRGQHRLTAANKMSPPTP
jgi:hypothetical protein